MTRPKWQNTQERPSVRKATQVAASGYLQRRAMVAEYRERIAAFEARLETATDQAERSELEVAIKGLRSAIARIGRQA